ncbi:predicted protein [Nematostella vectensis]|uniref:Peptidase M12B propeptide domain-containing protein n=1 Tax=Nematostella vectensis TaxID=45351 RepID=A7RW20_NEMVE|nr:predicted protein [Nematostella vectensis]|eukprot:XP_001636440.1 predicted protein [Nematostella vectensis]
MKLVYTALLALISSAASAYTATPHRHVHKSSRWDKAYTDYREVTPVRVNETGDAFPSSQQFLSYSSSVRDSGPLYYNLTVYGRTLRLRLLRDHSGFVSPGLVVEHVFSAGHKLPLDSGLAHCFYTGSIQGDSLSSAILSVCHGLRGTFFTGGQEYFIEPREQERLVSRQHPRRIHIVYRSLPDHINSTAGATCGLKEFGVLSDVFGLIVEFGVLSDVFGLIVEFGVLSDVFGLIVEFGVLSDVFGLIVEFGVLSDVFGLIVEFGVLSDVFCLIEEFGVFSDVLYLIGWCLVRQFGVLSDVFGLIVEFGVLSDVFGLIVEFGVLSDVFGLIVEFGVLSDVLGLIVEFGVLSDVFCLIVEFGVLSDVFGLIVEVWCFVVSYQTWLSKEFSSAHYLRPPTSIH